LPTVNEVLQDSLILHQVKLQHYANGVATRIIKLISQVDDDLQNEIYKALEKLPPESFTVKRLEKLLESIRELNSIAFADAFDTLDTELKDFTDSEAKYYEATYNKATPIQVSIASINAEQIYTAAMSQPFQGKLLKEWFSDLEATKAIRIRDAIRMGYVESKPIAEIVRGIVGTKKNKYADGILDISRRNAEGITRTALGHMASFTRDRFFEKNSDVIKAIQWQSTLDNRTSNPCRLRDNKLYTIDHKPIGHSLPWGGGAGNFHFNCRSFSIGITKSWKELGFDIDEAPISTRQSMNGQVPADLSYGDWLRKQPTDIQNDVLGKTRAKLFRDGASIESFANNKGKLLTLKDLYQ
jgi:hypothetical protein